MKALGWLYLLALYAFIYLPVAVLVLFSFQGGRLPVPPFNGPSLDWYALVLSDGDLMAALLNSVLVALASSSVALVLGFLAAHALARAALPGSAWMRGLLIAPMTVSTLVLGLGLLSVFNRLGLPPSLLAITTYTCACPPEVIQLLTPFKDQPPGTFFATVLVEDGSEPACGSVRQNAPIHSPPASRTRYCFFCAWVPNLLSRYCGSPLVTERITATEGSAAAISSRASAQVSESNPLPPHSSGVVIPNRPSSASFFSCGQGYSPVLSYSGASGQSTSRETWRTMSRTSFW